MNAPLVDLHTLTDVEPPSGDLGIKETVSHCRALWTVPIADEAGAPDHRIIHARTLQLHAPAQLHRLGLRLAQGYHKCGSHIEQDWVSSVRVRVWNDEQWHVLFTRNDIPCPADEFDICWFDLGGHATSSALIEIRRCGIDTWWPSWNLASGAFVLLGIPPALPAPKHERRLSSTVGSFAQLPHGVTAEQLNGEVRYCITGRVPRTPMNHAER